MSFDDFLKDRGRSNGQRAAAKAILNKVCEDAFSCTAHTVLLTDKEATYTDDDMQTSFDRLHKSFYDIADAYKRWRESKDNRR